MQDKHYVMAALYYEFNIPVSTIGPLFGIYPQSAWNIIKGKRHKNAVVWEALTGKEKSPFIEMARVLIKENGIREEGNDFPSEAAIVQAMTFELKLGALTISKVLKTDRRTVFSKAKAFGRVIRWENRSERNRRFAIDQARERFREWLKENV